MEDLIDLKALAGDFDRMEKNLLSWQDFSAALVLLMRDLCSFWASLNASLQIKLLLEAFFRTLRAFSDFVIASGILLISQFY